MLVQGLSIVLLLSLKLLCCGHLFCLLKSLEPSALVCTLFVLVYLFLYFFVGSTERVHNSWGQRLRQGLVNGMAKMLNVSPPVIPASVPGIILVIGDCFDLISFCRASSSITG